MQEKINVLFVGDSLNLYSGFSYVISKLMIAFYNTSQYKISYVNILSGDNDLETVCKIHGEIFRDILCDEYGPRIYNSQLQSETSYNNFDRIVVEQKPKIVISLVDSWQCEPLAYSQYRDTFYWVSYNTLEIPEYPELVMFPTYLDGNLRKSISNIMNCADLVIPVTQMGKENFEKINIKCSEPILCGVDFEKRCIENYTKEQVFGRAVTNDSFVFMTLGTNTERKRIDLVIESFALFLKEVDNPDKYFLYVHTNPNEASGGTDLISQSISLNVLNKILFPSSYVNNIIMPQSEVFNRISVMDCYIGLPSGEGFGYGIADSMMHGIPIIYVNYGGHVEYCKDAGLPVEVKAFYNSKNAYMKWAIADIEQASDQMIRIASDDNLRKRLGQKGIELTREISWENQARKFINLVVTNYNNYENSKSDLHNQFYLKRII